MDDATKRARDKWHYRGQVRPEFAETPKDGQESVWDYPRPPRVEADRREVRVLFRDTVDRVEHRCGARDGDREPTDVLHPAKRYSDGLCRERRRELAVRVEGPDAVLVRPRRRG